MKRALSFLAPLLLLSTAALADEAPKAESARTESKTTSATTTTTTTTTTKTDTIPAPDPKPADRPMMIGGPMPEVGKDAPDFELPAQDGKKVDLDDYEGKWVVLYFYPKDFTGGCTLEAKNFQADLAKFKEKDVTILGVSVDSVSSHKEFCTKESIEFKLLSDADHKVSGKYGALMEYKGTKFASRTTFLIDPKGVIRKVYPKVDPAKHSAEVLADLDALMKAPKG
jgi:thioredoxin-dependent peroxiredoxin